MINKLKKLFGAVYRRIYCRLDTVGYARSLGVKVGDNVHFYGSYANMFSSEPWLISIGSNVHVAAETRFITHDGGTIILKDDFPDYVLTGNIEIGNDVYIGIRAVILPGVKIGNRCIIGSCALVTKDIPDNSVAVGVPAKVTGTVDNYIKKIKEAEAGKNPRYYADLEYMHSLNPNKKTS
jgi:acetyltransferase-like isoleucine patch superfamily enzyme